MPSIRNIAIPALLIAGSAGLVAVVPTTDPTTYEGATAVAAALHCTEVVQADEFSKAPGSKTDTLCHTASGGVVHVVQGPDWGRAHKGERRAFFAFLEGKTTLYPATSTGSLQVTGEPGPMAEATSGVPGLYVGGGEG